jgi:hypothetical protein
MDKAFYILEKDGHYQLRLTRTHACLSCGRDLDKVLEKVEFYTRKYKTEGELLLMVKELNNGLGLSIPTEDKDYYIKRQEKESPAFDYHIEQAVARGYKHHKKDSPSPRKKGIKLKVQEKEEVLVVKLPKERPKGFSGVVNIRPIKIKLT